MVRSTAKKHTRSGKHGYKVCVHCGKRFWSCYGGMVCSNKCRNYWHAQKTIKRRRAKLDKIKTEEIIFTVKDKKLSVGGVSQNRTAEITYKDINAEDFVVRFPRTSVMPILNKDSDKVLLSIKENTPLQTVCELDHISISYVCASFNK